MGGFDEFGLEQNGELLFDARVDRRRALCDQPIGRVVEQRDHRRQRNHRYRKYYDETHPSRYQGRSGSLECHSPAPAIRAWSI